MTQRLLARSSIPLQAVLKQSTQFPAGADKQIWLKMSLDVALLDSPSFSNQHSVFHQAKATSNVQSHLLQFSLHYASKQI